MNSAQARLEFVTLEDASDQDRCEIEGILFTRGKREIKLPWKVKGEYDEEEEGEIEEGGEGEATEPEPPQQPETVPDQANDVIQNDQPPAAEWAHHQYEEGSVGSEVPPVRPFYPPQTSYVIMPTYPPMQYYPQPGYMPPPTTYYTEQPHNGQDIRPPRQPKKNEKQQQMPQQFVQYMPYPYTVMPPHHYPPFHPGPYPMEYQPSGFIVPPEQGYQHQEYQPEPMEMPPVKMENSPPGPDFQHLCYATDITLTPPKKKLPEEPPAEVPVEEPPALAAPPAQDPSPASAATPVVDDVVVEVAVPEVLAVPVDVPVEGTAVSCLVGESLSVASSPAMAPKTWASIVSPGPPTLKPLARVPPAPRHGLRNDSAIITSVPTMGDPQTKPGPVIGHHHDNRITDDPYTLRLGEKLGDSQLDHRPVNMTPRGLTNPGNYCYINAILQALIACPSFFNLIKSLPIPQGPNQVARIPIIGAMIELCQQFTLMPPKVKRRDAKQPRDEIPDISPGPSFEPRSVYNVLDKIRSSFSMEGRQEDAEEFLSCLLNGLNDEMFEVLKLVGTENTEVPNGEVVSEAETADEGDWQVMGPKNKGSVTRRAAVCGNTPISQIFRGTQISKVLRDGGENSTNVQPFFTLQLDVEKAFSVKDALENLVNKDVLEGVTCTKTNREVEAWAQTTLEDLPLTLILHLKCFDYKHDSCSKITKTLEYGVDLKIEPKLVAGSLKKYTTKQKSYKLVAVVYHDGKEATKGHYITDVYHVGLGTWIRYDDGNVRGVKEEHVLKPVSPRVPYLLVYRRSDTVSAK